MSIRRRAGWISTAGWIVATAVFVGGGGTPAGAQQSPPPEDVALHFESKIGDISDEAFAVQGLATLNDPRGWVQAGFTFRSDPASPYRVVLAEPDEVDALCLPLVTGGRVSCQNGNVVALNANRWRDTTADWDKGKDAYRQYMFNHEVGHLIGQFHPANRCPKPGKPEAVIAQQTKGLEGCQGNPWPLNWEILGARKRPVTYAPTPDVEPAVRAVNPGGGLPGTAAAATSPPAATTAAPTAATDAAPGTAGLPTATTEAADPPEATGIDDATTIPAESLTDERQLGDAPLSGLSRKTQDKGVDGTNLPVIIVLSFLGVTLVSLGIALLIKWRSSDRDAWHPDDELHDAARQGAVAINPEHNDGWESESIADLSGWSVQLGGGAGRQDAVTWVAPSRWTPTQTGLFLDAVGGLDPHSVEPNSVAACVSGLLKARGDLRPQEGEGLGVVLVGPTQVVAAVVGAAEVTEKRGDRTIATRRQGVVRLRGGEAAPLGLTLAQTGNDWPAGIVTLKEQVHDELTSTPLVGSAEVAAPPTL